MDEMKKEEILEMDNQPVLTLEDEPAMDLDLVVQTGEKEIVPAEKEATNVQFTEQEQKAVEEFAQKIDITNTNMVISYGASAQKNIAGFSETALNRVKTKDLGQVGDMLSTLVVELKEFSADAESGKLGGLFKNVKRTIKKMIAKYNQVEINVEKISTVLEDHQVILLKDIAVFDKMYDLNLDYFKELTMYIAAGKLKLDDFNKTVIPELKQKAEASNLPEDAQKVNDALNYANAFDKRLHDLELTRMISIQMGPQIRLLQNNDSLLVQKIQSSLVNTIPLWKSQMVLALGLAHSQQAMQAERDVTDMTNELLKKNADMLKQGSVEIAKEGERGIVDIETLTHTNKSLIETIDEVLQIQADGKQKRIAAQQELNRIENELKQKLLEIRN
jgi:uncharacterized protein YaaN involved in tellurite resistance